MSRRHKPTGGPSGETLRDLTRKVIITKLEESKAKAMLLGMQYDVSTHTFFKHAGDDQSNQFEPRTWYDADTLEHVPYNVRIQRRKLFVVNMKGA